MSKYPRTDAARLKDVCRHMAMAEECTRMEYELNEAKARIKRLEEALNGTVNCIVELSDCGNAGWWDAEMAPEIIAARAALENKESNP